MESYNERLRKLTLRRDAATARLNLAKAAVKDRAASLAGTLNPANIVRAHPWAATLCALAAGIAIVPLIKSRRAAPKSEPDSTHASQPNAALSNGNAAPQPWWQPVAGALLKNLCLLAVAAITRHFAAETAPANSRDTKPSRTKD